MDIIRAIQEEIIISVNDKQMITYYQHFCRLFSCLSTEWKSSSKTTESISLSFLSGDAFWNIKSTLHECRFVPTLAI